MKWEKISSTVSIVKTDTEIIQIIKLKKDVFTGFIIQGNEFREICVEKSLILCKMEICLWLSSRSRENYEKLEELKNQTFNRGNKK